MIAPLSRPSLTALAAACLLACASPSDRLLDAGVDDTADAGEGSVECDGGECTDSAGIGARDGGMSSVSTAGPGADAQACDTHDAYADADGDGYGTGEPLDYACLAPEGSAPEPGDCDDDAAAVHPGQDEFCGTGRDNNCDGEVDELSCTPPSGCFDDTDGDCALGASCDDGSGSPRCACDPHHLDVHGDASLCEPFFRWGDDYGGTGDDWGNAIAHDGRGGAYVSILYNDHFALLGREWQREDFTLGGLLLKLNADGEPEWVQDFPCTGVLSLRDLARDSAGNVWATGSFSQTLSLGGEALVGGLGATLLVKLSPAGELLHVAHYPVVGGWSNGDAIIVDGADNVLIAGELQGDLSFSGDAIDTLQSPSTRLFLAKFDSGGGHVWSHVFTAGTEASDLAVDAEDAVWVVGDHRASFANLGTPGAPGPQLDNLGMSDVFLARFDAGGNHLWSGRFAGPGHEEAKAVAVDSQGHVWISGEFIGELDPAGMGEGVLRTADDRGEGFLIHLSNDGTVLEARDLDRVLLQGLAPAPGQHAVWGVGGRYDDPVQLYLARFGPSGATEHELVAGSDRYDNYGFAIDAAAGDQVWITGGALGQLPFNSHQRVLALTSTDENVFAVKLDHSP